MKTELDGVFGFLRQAYKGNWQSRWADTPFMRKSMKAGKMESILAHQWSMMSLWFSLRRVSPNLDKVVNSEQLYEGILHHDTGETVNGDVPMVRQIGSDTPKHLSEREELIKITRCLPNGPKDFIVNWFDSFEQQLDEIASVEVLVAKFLDTLQGDHFALVYGNNLPENSELITKIVNKRFAPYTKRLVNVLTGNGHGAAAAEVSKIAQYHLDQIRSYSIKLGVENF